MVKSLLSRQLLALATPFIFVAGVHAQDWKVAESTHFRVFHVFGDEYGSRTAKYVEKCRKDYYKRWLGVEAAWDFKCDVYVYENKDAYIKATGMSTAQAFARVTYDTRLLREIHFYGDCEDVWGSVVPHEIAHVCLAGTLWTAKLPSWLDEGMAGQSESEVRLKEYDDELKSCTKRWGSRVLMNSEGYPKKGLRDWYCESISLVRYLLSVSNEKTFNSFVKLGMKEGWQKALKVYYDFSSYEDLDAAWVKSLKG